MSIDVVARTISDAIFVTIGQKPTFSFCLAELKAKYCRLGEFELNPHMCGPVGAMFASITVTVDAGIGPSHKWDPSMPEDYTPPTVLHMRYEYRYKHPDNGGSNGHTVKHELPIPA